MGSSIAVGLVARAAGPALAEAVESVLQQVERDLALVVVGETASVRGYADDPRVHLVDAAATRQAAWEAARSHVGEFDFFASLTERDVWHPEFLSELRAALEADADALVAFPQLVAVSERGADLGSSTTGDPSAGLFRRSALEDGRDPEETIVARVEVSRRLHRRRVEPLSPRRASLLERIAWKVRRVLR